MIFKRNRCFRKPNRIIQTKFDYTALRKGIQKSMLPWYCCCCALLVDLFTAPALGKIILSGCKSAPRPDTPSWYPPALV